MKCSLCLCFIESVALNMPKYLVVSCQNSIICVPWMYVVVLLMTELHSAENSFQTGHFKCKPIFITSFRIDGEITLASMFLKSKTFTGFKMQEPIKATFLDWHQNFISDYRSAFNYKLTD
jgi:hypothetical protein